MKRGCLDAAELEQVLAGELSAEAFDSAISHLDECPRCRGAAESVAPIRGWASESLSQVHDPLQSETACRVAMHQLLESSELSASGLHSPAASPQHLGLPLEHLGPYQLLRPLGSGGMACVFLAEHRRLKRRCAIKILPRERVDQPGWLERFDREMTSVASLEHSHVVRATDAGHQDGWHYLVMEYLEGMDVGAIAARMGQLDVADACQIIRQAALGLSHVHQQDLVHRDIKPSNLMLDREGNVKLLDLGLVLAGDDPLSVDDRLTTVGHLMGTLPYMAPEQLLDSRDVDAKADLYSLGATFFRLLTARLPHQPQGGLARQVMTITSEDAPPVRTLRSDLDPAIAQLVDQLLHRDPAQRPASADEVAERLREAAKAARLKKLLREASNRPAPQSPSPSQLWLSQPQVADHRSPPRRWPMVAAALLPLLLLLSGWTIKIATDRGDLVIHNNVNDATVEISQGDEVVERLTVAAGNDNTFRLRKGSYNVRIRGTSELILSDNTVTIGRGTESEISVLPKGAERLYQGKTFGHWLDLLRRESDVQTISQAMIALEILSRETALRETAAQATIKTARTWGGIVVSAPSPETYANEPSQAYMYHLRKVFPRYENVGVEVILEELREGNDRSRAAAVWLLEDMTEMAQLDDPGIVELLRTVSQSLEESSIPHHEAAQQSAKTLAIEWLIAHDQSVTDQPWLIDLIQQKVRTTTARWKDSNSVSAMQGPPIFDPPMMLAALQLQADGKLELESAFAVHSLLPEKFSQNSLPRTEAAVKVFEILKARAPDALLNAIDMNLFQLANHSFSHPNWAYQEYMEEYDHNLSGYTSVSALTLENSLWPLFLEFYAEHASPLAERTVDSPFMPYPPELLQGLRTKLITIGVDPEHPKEPLRFIDAAIETLERRQQKKEE